MIDPYTPDSGGDGTFRYLISWAVWRRPEAVGDLYLTLDSPLNTPAAIIKAKEAIAADAACPEIQDGAFVSPGEVVIINSIRIYDNKGGADGR